MNFFKASNFSLPTIYNKKRYSLSIFFRFCLIMWERFLFCFPSPELAYGCLNGCGWEHTWFSQELGHLCVMCQKMSRREATLGASALHTWFVQGLSSAGKHTLRTRIDQLCLIWGSLGYLIFTMRSVRGEWFPPHRAILRLYEIHMDKAWCLAQSWCSLEVACD